MPSLLDTPVGLRTNLLDTPIPVAPGPNPYLTEGELVKGLRRGAFGVMGNTRAAGAQVMENFSPDIAAQMYNEAMRDTEAGQRMAPAAVPTLKDIHSLSDVGDYVGGAIGEGLPTMGAALAGGVLGRGSAVLSGLRAPLARTVAGGAMGVFPMEAGEAALTMQNDPQALANTTPLQRTGLAAGKGAINAVLEAAPEAVGLNTLMKPVTRGVKGTLSSIGKSALIGGVAEGPLTEAPQEYVGQAFHTLANPERDKSHDTENIIEAAVKGALPGAALGGVHGGVRAMNPALGETLQRAADAAAPYVERAKEGFGTVIDDADEKVREFAKYAEGLPDVTPEQRDAFIDDLRGRTSDVVKGMADKVRETSAEVGDISKDMADRLNKHFDSVGWQGPGDAWKATMKSIQEHGLKGPAMGAYSGFVDLYKTLKRKDAKLAQEPVMKVAKQLDESKPTNIGDMFSKSNRDPVNQIIREQLAAAATPQEMIDGIASRVSTDTVVKNGRSNVSKVLREAVRDTLLHMDTKYAQVFSDRTQYNRLVEAVRAAVEPAIQKQIDETPNIVPDNGAISLYKDMVSRLYEGQKLDDDELDTRAEHFANAAAALSRGNQSYNARFVSAMRKQFGEKADAALNELAAIASVTYGDTPRAQNVQRAIKGEAVGVEEIAMKFDKLFDDPKEDVDSALDNLARFRTDVDSLKSLSTALKGKEQYSDVQKLLQARWPGIPKAKFEAAMYLAEEFSKHEDALTQGNLDKMALRDEGKGAVIGQRPRGDSSAAPRATIDDSREETDTTDQGDAVSALTSTSLDPDEEWQRQRAEENTGMQSVTDKPIYHGVGILKTGKHNRSEIQAPIALHPGMDYARGEYSAALEQAHAIYGHRVAQGEAITPWQWAHEAAASYNMSERELLDRAADALIAHDKERAKKLAGIPGSQNDLDWIAKRAKDLQTEKNRHPTGYGEAFFDPEGHHRNYRYYRMSQEDASNLNYNVDTLVRLFTPRKGESPARFVLRVAGKEAEANEANANAVRDSLISLKVRVPNEDNTGMEEKDVILDFAGLVASALYKHQQADVEGVTDSVHTPHSTFQTGETRANDSVHGIPTDDVLENRVDIEKDIKRVLAGEGNTREGLLKAVNSVMGMLLTNKDILEVGRTPMKIDATHVTRTYQRGLVEGMGKSAGETADTRLAKWDAEQGRLKETTHVREPIAFAEQSGFEPKTVMLRDLQHKRVLTYSDLSNFRSVTADGLAVREKGPVGEMSERDIDAIAPKTKGLSSALKTLKTGDPDRLHMGAARAAEHGRAYGALMKNGERHDLDMHALLNHMMTRYGIDVVEGNNDKLIPTELAAILLNEGMKELQGRHEFTMELDWHTPGRVGGDVKGNPSLNNVIVMRGWGEGGESRYGIKLGEMLHFIKNIGNEDFKSRVAAVSGKDADGSLMNIAAVDAAEIEKFLADADKAKADKKDDPNAEAKRKEEVKRLERLRQMLSNQYGFDPDNTKQLGSNDGKQASEVFPFPSGEPVSNSFETKGTDTRRFSEAGPRQKASGKVLGDSTGQAFPMWPAETDTKTLTVSTARGASGQVGVDESLRATNYEITSNQKAARAQSMRNSREQRVAEAKRTVERENVQTRANEAAEKRQFAALTETEQVAKKGEVAPQKTREQLRAEKLAEMGVPFSKSDNPHVQATWETLQKEKERLLGALFNLETGTEFAGKFNEELSTLFVTAGVNGLYDTGVLRHEVWHAVESVLRKAGPRGKEILDTVYKHVSTPMMKAWLENQLKAVGDQGALDHLAEKESPSERAAYTFQLLMEGAAMPLHSETKSKLTAVKNFIKKMLAKIGVEFTGAGDRTQAFFKFLAEGGFVREHDNPAALLAALNKTRSDNFVQSVSESLKVLSEGVDSVFGSTVNRLNKYNIPEYKEIIELYAGKTGKSGFIGEVNREVNRWSNVAADALQGLGESDREKFAGSKEFTAFVEKFNAYLESRGLTKAQISGIYNNLVAFDQDKVFKNLDQFTVDLTKHGGLENPKPGQVREIAQIIADSGFYDGDVSLFKNNREVKRKWEITDAKDYMARLIYAGVRKAERVAAFEQDDAKLVRLRKAGDAQATSEAKHMADRVFDAYSGTLGHGKMTNGQRQLTGVLLTLNNIRLLPFAVFSQMIEPLQLAFRKNDLGGALDSLWRGISDLPRTFDKFNKNYDKDYWERLAETVGTTASDIMGDTLGEIYNGLKFNGKVKWVNDKFFKYNFMEQWNRSMHVAATKHAVEFIKDHGISKLDAKHSERFIEELGLKGVELKLDKEGHLDTSDVRVQRAIVQYVNEAMAHPDVGSNTLWMNDPRFALIAHMKRFTFAYSTYILDRGFHEIKNGNYKPLLPVVLAVPWMLTSDTVRDFIKPGDEAYKDAWGFTDYLTRGVERTGLLGRLAIPADAVKAQTFGGNAIEGLLGPTAELIGSTVRAVQ